MVEIRTMEYLRYPQDDRLIFSPEIPKDKVLIWKKDLNRAKSGYYSEGSIGHPAKMHVKLAQWIIKNFTEFGDTILDPMAGIGTTLLEAAVLGRNAVGIEYEERFVMLCMENVGLFCRYPTLSRKGDIQVICGDARDMSELLSGRVDGVIMSPPYGEMRMDGGACGDRGNHIRPYSGEDRGLWRTQRDQDNLGNLAQGDIDTVIMSPPFSTSPRSGNKDPEKFRKIAELKHKRDFSKSTSALPSEHYSDDPENIGNLPHGKIDAIVTSPPYESAVSPFTGGGKGKTGDKNGV